VVVVVVVVVVEVVILPEFDYPFVMAKLVSARK
jgi:hypothetical protein